MVCACCDAAGRLSAAGLLLAVSAPHSNCFAKQALLPCKMGTFGLRNRHYWLVKSMVLQAENAYLGSQNSPFCEVADSQRVNHRL